MSELKLTITVAADETLAALLTRIADALESKGGGEPAADPAAEPEKPRATRKRTTRKNTRKAKAEEKPDEPESGPEAEAGAGGEPVLGSNTVGRAIRDFMKKEGKENAVKLLQKYGANRPSDLTEDQYAPIMEELGKALS